MKKNLYGLAKYLWPINRSLTGKGNRLTLNILKKASLEMFFQSLVGFSENPFYFYGEAVSRLTYSQIQLFALGKNYHHMLSQETEPPSDIKNDPEQLENWFQSYTKTRDLSDSSGDQSYGQATFGQASFVSGATPEDLEKVGIKDGTEDFFSEMNKYTDENGQVNIGKIIESQGKI